jgi:NAD(P)-dependent dehydrogenase (short-subunit alcohol dehydrogenase family)
LPLQLDVTDATSVVDAAEAGSEVSVLINNAGIARGASVLDRDTSKLREEMETNLFGPLAMASVFADRIAERSRRDCQRRVGARVDARRRKLWGDEGGHVERHRFDAG